ncbi:hypothetical protein E2320_013471, partial [Naja naja]
RSAAGKPSGAGTPLACDPSHPKGSFQDRRRSLQASSPRVRGKEVGKRQLAGVRVGAPSLCARGPPRIGKSRWHSYPLDIATRGRRCRWIRRSCFFPPPALGEAAELRSKAVQATPLQHAYSEASKPSSSPAKAEREEWRVCARARLFRNGEEQRRRVLLRGAPKPRRQKLRGKELRSGGGGCCRAR